DRAEVSAAEARKVLSQKRELAKNTVRTLLDRRAEKAWLKHREEGRTYLYSATQPGEGSRGQEAGEDVEHQCGGSAEELMTALLDYRGLSPEELKRIRAMLDHAKATRPTP